MDIILPDLCDAHGEAVTVLAPIFRNFGARRAFGLALGNHRHGAVDANIENFFRGFEAGR